MPHRLDDITCARFALGANEGGALRDATQGLAQVAAAADEGNLRQRQYGDFGPEVAYIP